MTGRPTITSDYLSVILRAIEKAESDPAQLRNLVYDLARLSLGKHVLTNYRQLGSEGLQRQVHNLEAAINQAESLAQKSDAVPNIEELLLARPADSLNPLPSPFAIYSATRSLATPGVKMSWSYPRKRQSRLIVTGARSPKSCDRSKFGSRHSAAAPNERVRTFGGVFNWRAQRSSGSGSMG